jgi:hypothetical protein
MRTGAWGQVLAGGSKTDVYLFASAANSMTGFGDGCVVMATTDNQRIFDYMAEFLYAKDDELDYDWQYYGRATWYQTVSPAAPQQQQNFHYWRKSQEALIEVRRKAKQLVDDAKATTQTAKTKFFDNGDWPADRGTAAVLADIAGFPTRIIAMILLFANPDTVLQFDATLHCQLLEVEEDEDRRRGRKRKRST